MKEETKSIPTQLKAELKKVCEVAPPPPPKEDPIYKYLSGVYRLRRKVASSVELQNALKAYHRAHMPKTLQQYAGAIIQMTAGDHVTSNMKHKYVATLEYAFANQVKSTDLKSFIQKQGGINKCVALWKKNMTANINKSQKKPRKLRLIAADVAHPGAILLTGVWLVLMNWPTDARLLWWIAVRPEKTCDAGRRSLQWMACPAGLRVIGRNLCKYDVGRAASHV